jgi:hypothetical protein
LEALKSAAIFVDSFRGQKATQEAITALQAALEQPSQEPVAWAVQGITQMIRGEFAELDAKSKAKRIGGTCVAYPLYTAPPQRQWVGLTDEDVNRESAMIASKMKLAFHAGMYVAQNILEERNT